MHIEDEFFFVDSNTITNLKTKLYGYCISDVLDSVEHLYEYDDIRKKQFDGCYVLIKENEDDFVICQDSLGCYGIYEFHYKDYWAISNSYLLLLQNLSGRYKFSPNIDYIKHFILRDLCSCSCTETPVNEISLSLRNCVFYIDKSNRKLRKEYIDNKNGTIPLDSEEALSVIDAWVSKWTGFIRKLENDGEAISVDLSGGFDSRLILLLFLCSGIDLNNIRVFSNNDGLHCHTEDYRIACEIANHFGFELNRNINVETIQNTTRSMVNSSLYTKIGFHKELYFKRNIPIKMSYSFSGSGGEAMRAYDSHPLNEFIDRYSQREKNRFGADSNLLEGLSEICKKDIEALESIYKKKEIADSVEFGALLYNETRVRHHYGKATLEDFLSNICKVSPFLDSDFWNIKVPADDQYLLFAIIMQRYCPDLFLFDFEGNRCISDETKKRADMINKKYPVNARKNLNLTHIIVEHKRVLKQENDDFTLSAEQVCYDAFQNIINRERYIETLSKKLYEYADEYKMKTKFFPLAEVYASLGIMLSMEACASYHEDSFSKLCSLINDNNYARLSVKTEVDAILRLLRYSRCDIRLQNKNIDNSDLIFLDLNDISIDKPRWFYDGGAGYLLESTTGKISFKCKCINDGLLQIWLRGKDYRANNQRKQIYVDYDYLRIDDSLINEDMACSHDDYYYYEKEVKKGQIVKVDIQSHIHNYSIDELSKVVLL